MVARSLGAPRDVIVVRKLGLRAQPEVAVGAVGEGGVTVLDDDVLDATGVDTGRSRPSCGASVRRRWRGRPGDWLVAQFARVPLRTP